MNLSSNGLVLGIVLGLSGRDLILSSLIVRQLGMSAASILLLTRLATVRSKQKEVIEGRGIHDPVPKSKAPSKSKEG